MPIQRKDNKWYWGSRGPFTSRKRAEQVAGAAYAAGYKPKKAQKLLDSVNLYK
jgi:hypothetical protein